MSKGAKWINRNIFLSPVYIGLCKTEDQFKEELKKLKIPMTEWPSFNKSEIADATTHFFFAPDKSTCCIVCMKQPKAKTLSQINALICHETIHIWQEIKTVIGEKNPSYEFEAYCVQGIFQNLAEAFHKK
jgi:hypothetical protein